VSRKPASSRRLRQRVDWLGREQPARERPWALTQQLFGAAHASEDRELLGELATQLSQERAALTRLEAELHEQVRRVAELERRLQRVAPGEGAQASQPSAAVAGERAATRRPPVIVSAAHSPTGPGYLLSRCDGFLAESPLGQVGVVCGVRFRSRIDRPDLLAIEVGRLRHKLLLVPVDEVEHVSFDEERVVLQHDPRAHPHRELANRLRSRLRTSPF
jgi:hypothetical protein